MFPLDQQDIDHLAPEGWLRIASLVAIALEVLGLGVIPRRAASPPGPSWSSSRPKPWHGACST
jgi:hypothetical protein